VDWADELATRVRDSGPQVVNDSKTPSGTVHVGSLRGPVILDTITRALRANGVEATLLYGVDDLDPMDAQALLTPDAIEREMGRPLAHVPDPAGDCHDSYARHFAGIFIDTFAGLGIHPDRYYWMSEIYPTGAMDPYIRTALDRAALVRDIYRRVANVQHPDTWHPVGLICPQCGKVGTTIVTDWDGERVHFECRARHVEWATGCGATDWVSPFGGAAKLPWNLEWAAQWSLFGVTIEPCGKDLSTAGGSRDRSDAIAREIFEREPPLNVPYEFLNIGGKKMSTSKGRGAAAHTIAEVIPPEQLRFLLLRPRPNHAIDFDPDGTDQIPRLFDEFDKFAAATAGRAVKGELPPGHAATFRYSLLEASADVDVEAAAFRPSFSHLAMLVQIPGVDVAERATDEKGSALTPRETAILEEREGAARGWLAVYAPDRAVIRVHDTLPVTAAELDDAQRGFLAALADAVGPDAPSSAGDDWQNAIFAVATEVELPAGRAFDAIYRAFLGRPNGPRAGWLLASLAPRFVLERLREAAARPGGAAAVDVPMGGAA
jgi:lysyl-tRNA synthetase class 1